MDGAITEGWYQHPQQGLIRVKLNKHSEWVYICYSKSGAKALSKERSMDQWIWALCETDPNH